MKIHILLCDTFPGLLPSDIPSYESMFIRLFQEVDSSLTFDVIPTWKDVWRDSLHLYDLYLITGSNDSVYDRRKAYVRHLLKWILQAHSMHVRMVGICFGHQAIAHALGGEVRQFSGGWGAGLRSSTITEPHMLDYFPNGEMKLLCNHHDQVVRLPDGAKPCATSSFCQYESFRISNEILTFQGHPEYTVEYMRHLLLNHSKNEDPVVTLRAMNSTFKAPHDGSNVARYILDFYDHT